MTVVSNVYVLLDTVPARSVIVTSVTVPVGNNAADQFEGLGYLIFRCSSKDGGMP